MTSATETIGISHAAARFGFRDKADVPETLSLPPARRLESDIDLDSATYFLSKMTIVPGEARGMGRRRKRLFKGMSRTAAHPADFFELPHDQVVTMGTEIEL
jgi:KUP system potassium uptake protein